MDYQHLTKAELAEELQALDEVVAWFAFDAKGVVRGANERGSELLGVERRAIVGKPFSRFVEPEQAARFADHLRGTLEGAGGRRTADLQLRVGDRSFAVRLESVRSSSGSGADRVRTVVYDVADRRQLEEQLLHAQRMEAVGRLAGGVAHDFNNLLMTILGHTELLLLRLQEDAARSSVKTIQETAERATTLTRQLVTFSRKGVVAPRVLDPNVIIREMDKILRRLIGEDVQVVYELDPRAGCIKVDPTHLEQVVMNLAVNARDAMPEGGRLTIATVERDGHVELAVTDTGVGMDAETAARIFEPFFTTKEAGKGTGLGLSTVQAIVEQSNARLEVASEPGRGTTFRAAFPRVADAPESVRTIPRIDAPSGTESVLVVEDEETVRELVAEMLRMKGYRVVEARHGGEALLLCEQRPGEFDLMVTDVVMPQMSGRQLAERLAPLQPKMKVLFMSGHTEDAVLRHGVENALVTMIQKPFTPVALAHRVRAVLDGGAPGHQHRSR